MDISKGECLFDSIFLYTSHEIKANVNLGWLALFLSFSLLFSPEIFISDIDKQS